MRWMRQCCTKDHTAPHRQWRFLHSPPSSSITHLPARTAQLDRAKGMGRMGNGLIKNKGHLQDAGFRSSPGGTVRPTQVDRNKHVPKSCAPKQSPQRVPHSKNGVSPLAIFCLYHWGELRDARYVQEGPSDHGLRTTLTAITSCPQHSSRQFGLSTPN